MYILGIGPEAHMVQMEPGFPKNQTGPVMGVLNHSPWKNKGTSRVGGMVGYGTWYKSGMFLIFL